MATLYYKEYKDKFVSTLEKAFLKAMSLESEESKSEETGEPEGRKRSRTTNTHEVLASAKGISLMEDVDRFSLETMVEKRLIHPEMKDRRLLDRYRNIRTKLLADNRKENFVTLVTSVVPYENSSLVTGNLAATFSLDEAKTTMLIEADISNPRLNDLFDMTNRKGLVDYLSTSMGDCSQILNKTGVPRLRFVPSGFAKENSAEYFTSNKMNEFVSELIERYPDRYPIINAPCVVNSADTRILIELCDRVLLVIPYGMCTDEQVMHAALTIGEEKLAGVVLDGF